jgi:hypothetical protein
LPSDEQRSAPPRHLVLVKGAGRTRRKKRDLPPSASAAPQEQELLLIDCRPDLYERLAKVRPLPIWTRCSRAVGDAIRFLSSKLRRERRESNDN